MGERKGQNKYIPPDFDPARHGTLNGYQGVHPLRERASKLASDGILIVRFELPFSVWCDGCGQLVPMATRYNAEKTRVGSYFSTPIFAFKFRCRECRVQEMVVQTDPENAAFKLVSGGRKKHDVRDLEDSDAPLQILSSESAGRAADPMARIEHADADLAKGREAAPVIAALQSLRTAQFAHDYDAGAAARAVMRATKRRLAAEKKAREEHMCPSSITLLAPTPEDAEAARRVAFDATNPVLQARKRRRDHEFATRSASIFASSSAIADAAAAAHAKRRKLLSGVRVAIPAAAADALAVAASVKPVAAERRAPAKGRQASSSSSSSSSGGGSARGGLVPY